MKNILFLSSMYPNPLRPGTDVCHFYTREWVKMGYNVIVIHFRSMFPRCFTDMARLFPGLAHKYIGNHVEMDRNMSIVEYELDGIKAFSMPIFKYIPHAKYPDKSITDAVKAIEDICLKQKFDPDAIIGHFYNPTTAVIYQYKLRHPDTKSCIVFHEGPDGLKKHYKNKAVEIMESFNIVGFRHKSMGGWFETVFGKLKRTFICYSGTKPNYLESPVPEEKVFRDTPITKFIYVGQLTYNKCVLETIEALNRSYPDKSFKLTCVGSGGTAVDDIKNLIKKYNLNDNVLFTGQIERDDIIKFYDEAECFVMISRSEAFGLVYLEAMARGCICIGTRGQGIDGVIVDGENGFLCEGGNVEELTAIIKRINGMPAEEKTRISRKARETAESLSDFNVAKLYIDSVMES